MRPAGELAYTGSRILLPLLLALLLLAVGSVATVAARGRPHRTIADVEETDVYMTRRIPRSAGRG